MPARTAISSFSNAREFVEIPLLAADLRRLLLPRQNQILALLHPHDSLQRTCDTLTSKFLSRVCLSGAIEKPPSESWRLVLEAVAFYQRRAPVIQYGSGRRFCETGESLRHPSGWRAMVAPHMSLLKS